MTGDINRGFLRNPLETHGPTPKRTLQNGPFHQGGDLVMMRVALDFCQQCLHSSLRALQGLHEIPILVQQHTGYVRREIVSAACLQKLVELLFRKRGSRGARVDCSEHPLSIPRKSRLDRAIVSRRGGETLTEEFRSESIQRFRASTIEKSEDASRESYRSMRSIAK